MYLSVHPFLVTLICLSHLPTYPSIYPYTYCIYEYYSSSLSFCPALAYLTAYPPICPFISPIIHLSVYLSLLIFLALSQNRGPTKHVEPGGMFRTYVSDCELCLEGMFRLHSGPFFHHCYCYNYETPFQSGQNHYPKTQEWNWFWLTAQSGKPSLDMAAWTNPTNAVDCLIPLHCQLVTFTLWFCPRLSSMGIPNWWNANSFATGFHDSVVCPKDIVYEIYSAQWAQIHI